VTLQMQSDGSGRLGQDSPEVTDPADGDTTSGDPFAPAPSAPRAEDRQAAGWAGGVVAVLAWLIATPVAFVLPSVVGRDPFSVGASTMPLLAAFVLVVAVFAVAARWSGQIVAGAAAGLGAAWFVFMLRSALHGTPFGFGGLTGDMGRMSATVTHYTTTIASSDTLDPSLPSEYPPFYAWLTGRAAVLLDEPAWRLLGDVEVLFISASVLAAFLLWRRHVNPWVALAIAGLSQVTWSDPRKAFEVLTLAIFVPWVLEVFARPPRARMHWLPAGLLGGLIAMTYQAWMVYAVFGIVALMVLAWRSEPSRWAYLGRIALVVVVAFVVSSWYVVPFVWATFTEGGQQISDLYPSATLNTGLFPFLDVTPVGMLQLVGLVGLVTLWRSTWWARPMALIVAGVYGYRLISMIRYGLTGHSGFLHYTSRLYETMFAIAGVLVVAHVVPLAARRLRFTAPRLAAAVALAVVLSWTATAYTGTWMPKLDSEKSGNKYAVSAHTEPLPEGGYPAYAPKEDRRTWFPVVPVRQAVEGVLGPDPRPVTLSVDDRVFSYLPWLGYIENDRTAGSSLSRWDDRYAEIQRLAATKTPRDFATESAQTAFGPIDLFVLREEADGWAWKDQRFSPTQFAPEYWTVVDGLPGKVVVAIRR
jgi:hypothetical protein